jgi:hypothetical protein
MARRDRPVVERHIAPPIFGQQGGRDQFLSDIRRIADHKIEPAPKVGEQEVAVDQPRRHDSARLRRVDTRAFKQIDDLRPRLGVGTAMQLDGSDAVGQITRATCGLERGHQTLDGCQQKLAAAKGRFEQAHAVDRAVHRVARQVQHEIDHFTACEDGAALAVVGVVRQLLHRIRDGAHARKTGLFDR